MMTVDTSDLLCEYRVKLVRGSVGTRAWKYLTIHASSPQEAYKKAHAELGKGWRNASCIQAILY